MAHPTPKRAPEEIAHEVERETIHVPRGKSRARYLLTIGLLIFILVIFVVSDLFTNIFGGRTRQSGAFFTWVHPTKGLQEWSGADFQLEQRRLLSVQEVLRMGRSQEFTDEKNLARLIVLDELAREAGIEVGSGDLRKALTDGAVLVLGKASGATSKEGPEFFLQVPPIASGDSALYRQWLASSRTPISAPEFETELRRLMRVERFESLMLLPGGPTPEQIEKAWREEHDEHRFEFVAFDVAAARAQVDLETPDEAALRAWYDGLDVPRKRSAFAAEWLPERVTAELLAWSYDAADPQALLEKYPRPPDADLEQIARDYHTTFKNVRFRRPEEKADAPTADERLFFGFDEVADQARRESLVHAALVEYAAALQGRIAAGETVDLATEAAGLGLAYVQQKEPLSAAEWQSHGTVGDPRLGGAVLSAARGDRFVSLVVGAKAFVFGRTDQRVEAGAPPFDSIAARVAEEWKKDRALEVAKQNAQSLHDAFLPAGPTAPEATAEAEPVTADAEAFAAAAKKLDAQVHATEWIDRADVRFDAGEPDDTELERFQRELAFTAGATLDYEEARVSDPIVSSDRQRVYVVRKTGQREPPEVAIEPAEYAQLHQRLAVEAWRADRERLLGYDALVARYQVAFPGRVERPENGDDPASN